MPIILTETAKLLSQQTNIKVNIILEIEGFNYKFGTLDIDKDIQFDLDGISFDEGYNFDASIVDENSRPWISLDGTTKNITSQLNPDKGIEAVRSFTIDLLDKDNELSQIFTPGHTVSDLLGQKAKVYLNFKGSDHPVDSLLIIEGIVGQYTFTGKGTCKVVVDHAAQLKRQEIFVNHATELDGILASGASTIPVVDASGFLQPTSEFLTYVKIDEEIIRYEGISGNNLIDCTREQLDTIAPSEHDNDTEVTSFYRLQGNAIDLALKIMLSGGGYGLEKSTTAFGFLTDDLTVANSILFESKDIETEFGLVVGDHVQITGSDSNNVTTTITDFRKIDSSRSYIVVAASLTNEDEQSATVKFKSKYDTLVEGAGLLPTQLDVASHLYWYDLFSGNFAEMDFYLEEPIEVDEFVNQELYRPTNLYSVPGNRPSVKMTIPPLTDVYTKTLNDTNIVNPKGINVSRSVNKYHYNTIIYKYDPDRLDLSKYLTGKVVLNNDSLTRIRAGKKPFKIESQGLRRDAQTKQILDINARRFLDRYKFAAEFFSVETFFSNIDIEVGDIVVIGGVNIYDSENGTRDLEPRLFEVINKSVSIGKSSIKLDLLSTGFGLDGRFGVVSPASNIGSGATTTSIPLKSSFGFTSPENEKWQPHIGATVRIHSNDWSYNETATITGFDPSNENTMLVNGLSVAPSEDYIVDTCDYSDSDNDAQSLLRDMYLFVDPSLTVTGASDSSTITVSSDDAAKLFEGSVIEVHNSSYTNASESKVASVVGTTVNLEDALDFTPSASDSVQLVGFVENNGKPYRII